MTTSLFLSPATALLAGASHCVHARLPAEARAPRFPLLALVLSGTCGGAVSATYLDVALTPIRADR